MQASRNLIELQKQFEGCKLRAYKCPAGKWTIGYGNTYYMNGTPVKEGDKLNSIKEAEQLFLVVLNAKVASINKSLKVTLTQNQFDVLCDIAYNAGLGALLNSGLFKAINANPKDKNIPSYLMQWNKSDGSNNGKDDDKDGIIDEEGEKQVLNGLTLRCKKRAELWVK